jgi:CRP-like cAMP-binding protein
MERLRKDILDQVREAGPAPGLNAEKALQTLLVGQPVNTYRKKQPIFSEGNHPQFLFYLKTGRAKVYKTSDDGKELTVGLYGAGDFLGYIALLENNRYEVSAEALQETDVVLISGSEFLDLVHGNSQVATWFFRLVAQHNNEKAEQLVQVAYHSLRKRVAGSLLLLLRKYSTGDTRNFSIHISREELANLAGTATESLIRTLADFRHEKLIDIREGDIVILHEKGLEEMIN